MKKLIFSCLSIVILLNFGCTTEIVSETDVSETPSSSVETTNSSTPSSTLGLDGVKYTMFILNVHDWLNGNDSIETVNKVIDIHEKYEVPVNIYLTDPVVQLYVEKAPDLIERFKTSKYVTISYHSRAPTPYYSNFDIIGIHELSDDEIYDKIMEYETHKIDLATGLPTESEGGYAYLKEIIGYAPVTVGIGSEYKNVETQLMKVYKTLGASFTLTHAKEALLGDTKGGLYLRPEQIPIKLYESKALTSKGDEVIKSAISNYSGDTSKGEFINIKFHEDNFYLNGSPWIWNFYTDGQTSDPKSTPFDITTVNVKEKTDAERAHMWTLYEEAVEYVKDNSETMHPISEFDLEDMLSE